jgi:hypothetical protein
MGGNAGTEGGLAGDAGAPAQCGESPAGTFCILGTPADDGKVDLVAGMPLAISVHTTGCRTHQCSDEIVSASCRNVLGSEGSYWISPYICFAGDGEPCGGDRCGGVADTSCETGITLEAGQYTVALGGSPVSIGFTVPSHVALTELCH